MSASVIGLAVVSVLICSGLGALLIGLCFEPRYRGQASTVDEARRDLSALAHQARVEMIHITAESAAAMAVAASGRDRGR